LKILWEFFPQKITPGEIAMQKVLMGVVITCGLLFSPLYAASSVSAAEKNVIKAQKKPVKAQKMSRSACKNKLQAEGYRGPQPAWRAAIDRCTQGERS